MATDSSNKLTKFVSTETIVTADFANSMYGGLYGSSEGDDLSATDPRVAGHVHDGVNADGHAQKVDLVNHVTNKLTNSNLADDAVTKRNIAGFTSRDDAIPTSEVIDGVTYYYLDLDEANAFSKVQVSAEDTGLVGEDGEGTIEADSSSGTLSVVAGDGITIDTDFDEDEIKISVGLNIYRNVSVSNTGSGSSSGGPLNAQGLTDTLNIEADDGIDLVTTQTGTDNLKIKNSANNFRTINIAAQSGETGVVSGSYPVVADSLDDSLNLAAGYGIELQANAFTDKIIIRNYYSVSQTVLNMRDWVNGSGGGWGNLGVLHRADSDAIPDTLSVEYKVVSDDDYVYAAVPLPINLSGLSPTQFSVRAYFIVRDVTTSYIAAQDPNPTFSIELGIGSNENQTSNTAYGTVGDDQDITADTETLWSTNVTGTSAGVSDENKLYIVSWSGLEFETSQNAIGLLFLRMIGGDGFGAGEDFNGENGRAAAWFLKADICFHY